MVYIGITLPSPLRKRWSYWISDLIRAASDLVAVGHQLR